VRHAAASLALTQDKITVREGDTAALGCVGGTGGSKSMLTSSRALEQAILDVIDRGRAVLAREWNAPGNDIHFESRIFSLPGSNRAMSVTEVAASFPAHRTANPAPFSCVAAVRMVATPARWRSIVRPARSTS
jgi:aerobic carbon-monoxide dehydrogenase large subunit